jgi:hypothetical protein
MLAALAFALAPACASATAWQLVATVRAQTVASF